MRVRELAWSLFCVGGGAALVYVLRLGLGDWPNPAVAAGVLLMSLGAGLVGARFSRLGPFDGELGAPWQEHELRDLLAYEINRASRYARDLSVAAVRCDNSTAGWETAARSVDRLIPCRRGWVVLILPETSGDGAEQLLRRIAASDHTAQMALVNFPDDVTTAPDAARALLQLVRGARQPGAVLRAGQRADIVVAG